jgi:hypothetical protein
LPACAARLKEKELIPVASVSSTGHSKRRLQSQEDVMTFKLPELPYAYDALAHYMSRETLE